MKALDLQGFVLVFGGLEWFKKLVEAASTTLTI